MNLTTKQKQHLKGLAHSLKPVVMLGSNGLTEGVLAEIDSALSHHELIKVKVASADRELKNAIVDAIIRETQAVKVQMIGHVLVLFRQSEEMKIAVPQARK
ncbi:ribosome assembly RNA-binding protein YhbY [uncultured Shewanella sp.]|uniref:ribosome assembly RNA-binding protein YhbY n=1 Tax=uncultured Shewanella sp. TaxID=173975 RepID=UPI00262F0CFE|nr:ribosome assembly RNA-binding protein YhbY [uncultured Shewanella sp.]